MYLDTVHRGGQAFVVALGVDREGKKLPLGFWEGATENHEICEELLEELERRGLKLSKRILWVDSMVAGGSSRRSKTDTARSSSTSGVLCTKTATSSATCPNATASKHTTSSRLPWSRTDKDAKKMLQEFERWPIATSTSRRLDWTLLEALEEKC